MCSDAFFTAGTAKLGEEIVREIYNAADLMLTTTLGEGWGFALTEALACGCPIAAPAHTSCWEIMVRLANEGTKLIFPLKVEHFAVVNAMDNSRFRPSVETDFAVGQIKAIAESKTDARSRTKLSPQSIAWMNWDRIAKEWEPMLLGS
jgi:glycosyltransferase involved in cell wall biosynthesis